MTFAQFRFFKTFFQQVAPNPAKKLSASTTLASGLFFGKKSFDVVVGCQAIIQAFDEIRRPLRFYRSRPNKVETKHPPDCGMAFSRYIMNMEGCLRGMQDGVIGS